MRTIIYLTIAIISIVSLFVESATAELKSKPSEVCGYVKDIGLSTSGWKKYSGNIFGCTSIYKDIGSSGPASAPALKNNLAYYGEGTATVVLQLQLVLNVNNPSESNVAHSELIRAAEVLVKKALGISLSDNIRNAIAKGKAFSLKTGSTTIDVVREDWPTGKGYEIRVTIK